MLYTWNMQYYTSAIPQLFLTNGVYTKNVFCDHPCFHTELSMFFFFFLIEV